MKLLGEMSVSSEDTLLMAGTDLEDTSATEGIKCPAICELRALCTHCCTHSDRHFVTLSNGIKKQT